MHMEISSDVENLHRALGCHAALRAQKMLSRSELREILQEIESLMPDLSQTASMKKIFVLLRIRAVAEKQRRAIEQQLPAIARGKYLPNVYVEKEDYTKQQFLGEMGIYLDQAPEGKELSTDEEIRSKLIQNADWLIEQVNNEIADERAFK